LLTCIFISAIRTVHYGLDGPGNESRWVEIFRTCPDRPWGPPSLLYNGYRVFPGVKCGRGVLLTTHPLLVPRSWKGTAIPLPTLWATTGPVTGTLYLLIRTVHIVPFPLQQWLRERAAVLYTNCLSCLTLTHAGIAVQIRPRPLHPPCSEIDHTHAFGHYRFVATDNCVTIKQIFLHLCLGLASRVLPLYFLNEILVTFLCLIFLLNTPPPSFFLGQLSEYHLLKKAVFGDEVRTVKCKINYLQVI
jgi:hypothetical protein